MVRAQSSLGRYFVVMDQPSVAQKAKAAGGSISGAAEKSAAKAALASQAAAISQTKSMGGSVVFRYMDLIDGFSAQLTPSAASALAARSDVASVQPVGIVTKLAQPSGGAAKRDNGSSVGFIGAKDVWKKFHVRGDGVKVADIDTGVDYTHKDFGGPGTVAAYNNNDPNYIEPGTFPTKKVVGGYDLVGSNYDVLDDDPTNDTPRPDPDPLDRDTHGTHTSGTCCGNGVPGSVPKGIAPNTKLYEYKVWDVGNSTDDVLAKAYEMAMDPNQDGSLNDAVDVITFSGGVDYGTQNSVEAQAAQRVTQLGTVFVAAAGATPTTSPRAAPRTSRERRPTRRA